jgi:LysR family nitrogen assimilation transcriptional regulator
MEIRQLRYFKVITEAGSFARGANNLRVAQPALSRSIAKLEEELGQDLFVRHSTGVSLTEAGTRLYEQATEILTKVRDVVDGMAEASVPSGIVRLGAPQTLHSQLLVPIAISYLSRYSRCELDLVQDSGFRLREMVSNGSLDMAIVPSAVDGSLHCTPLVRESVCLILRSEERTSFPDTIELSEIAHLPLILTGYPGSLRLSIDRQFPQLQTQLNVRSEVNSASLLIDLVLGNVGYGLAPCSIVARRVNEGVSYVPINGLNASWSLAVSFSRLRLVAVQTLEALIIDYVKSVAKANEWPTAELISS